MNDNTPVIIGTGQLVDRDADVENFIEPLAMLVQVAERAAEDAGIGPASLTRLDTVGLVGTAGWHPDNPANLVAGKLGASPAREYVTGTGGQMGVSLVNHVANEIVHGRSEMALVAGCNNLRVLMKARAMGQQLSWTRGGSGVPDLVGTDEPGSSELEGEYGLSSPPDIYPLFENALRAKLGLSLEAHRERMGSLFTRFTEVAANNPYAWFPTKRSAEELVHVTPQNRMISFPYPKYLNAVLNTEQAAGLLVVSAATARRLGVPESQWVYWRGGAASNEKAWWASERPSFSVCPAMKDTHVSALANAGIELNEIDRFDFYSCFPSAVEMACEMLELPIDDQRGFTVTGGLPYAGGPASAYTLHSLAEMTRTLRTGGGNHGLVTGNGWYLTKHSSAVLSVEPGEMPSADLAKQLPSDTMDTDPCPVNRTAQGHGVLETYTVAYDRRGRPSRGVVLGRTDDGDRFLANTPDDIDFLTEFVANEQVGTSGTLEVVAGHVLFTPL